MGLDSFFVVENEEGKWEAKPVEIDSDISLCGGLFSGNGAEGSFRGKVYAPFIEELCGISLYQELMPNEQVCQIADALEKFIETMPDDYVNAYDEYIMAEQVQSLAKVFRAYADDGQCLHGWW